MSSHTYKNYTLHTQKEKNKKAIKDAQTAAAAAAVVKTTEGNKVPTTTAVPIHYLNIRKRKREQDMATTTATEVEPHTDRTGDDMVGVVSPQVTDALHKLCDMVFCVDFGGVGACVVGRRTEAHTSGNGALVYRRAYDIVLPWGALKKNVPEWELMPGVEWSGAYAYTDPDSHEVRTGARNDTGRKAIPEEKWYAFDLEEAGSKLVDLSGPETRQQNSGMFPLGIVAPYHVDVWEPEPKGASSTGERLCSYRHAGMFLMYNARVLRIDDTNTLYFNENGVRVLASNVLGQSAVDALSMMQNATHFEEFEGEKVPVLLFRQRGDGKSRTGVMPGTLKDSPVSYMCWEELYAWLSELTRCVPVRMGNRMVDGEVHFAVIMALPALMLNASRVGYVCGSHSSMKVLLANAHETTRVCGDSMHLWEDVHKRSLVVAAEEDTRRNRTHALEGSDAEYITKLLVGYARCVTDHVRLMAEFKTRGAKNEQEFLVLDEADRMLAHRGMAYARLQAMCYVSVSRFLWENGRYLKEMILPSDELWVHVLKNAGQPGQLVVPYEIVEDALFRIWASVYEHALKHKNSNLVPSGRNPAEAYMMTPRFRSVYKYMSLPVARMEPSAHTPSEPTSAGDTDAPESAFVREMDDEEEEREMQLEEEEEQDAYVWEEMDREFVDTPNVPVEELRKMWLKNAETERLVDVADVMNSAYRVLPSKRETGADGGSQHQRAPGTSSAATLLKMPVHWAALFGSARQLDVFVVTDFSGSGVTAAGFKQKPRSMLHMALDTGHSKMHSDTPSDATRAVDFEAAVAMLHTRVQTDGVRFVCTVKTAYGYTLAKHWKAMDEAAREVANYWDDDLEEEGMPNELRAVREEYSSRSEFLDVYASMNRLASSRKTLEDAWLVPVNIALSVLKEQYESVMDMEKPDHRYYNSLSRLARVAGEGTSATQFAWRALLTAFLAKANATTISSTIAMNAATSSSLHTLAEYWNTRSAAFSADLAAAFRGNPPTESVKSVAAALRRFPFHVADLYLYHHLVILHYTLYLATFLANEAATREEAGAKNWQSAPGASAYTILVAFLDWPLFSRFVRGSQSGPQFKDTARAEKLAKSIAQGTGGSVLPKLDTLKEMEKDLIAEMEADAQRRKTENPRVPQQVVTLRVEVVDRAFLALTNPTAITYQEYQRSYENAMLVAAEKEVQMMQLDEAVRKKKKQASIAVEGVEANVARLDAAELELLETSTILVLQVPEYTEACIEDELNMPPTPSLDTLTPYEAHLLAFRMRNYASLIGALSESTSFIPLPTGVKQSSVREVVKGLLPRDYAYRRDSELSDNKPVRMQTEVTTPKPRRVHRKKKSPIDDTHAAQHNKRAEPRNAANTAAPAPNPPKLAMAVMPPVAVQPKRKRIEAVKTAHMQEISGEEDDEERMPIVPATKEMSVEVVPDTVDLIPRHSRCMMCLWLEALAHFADPRGYDPRRHSFLGDRWVVSFDTVSAEAAAIKELCAVLDPTISVLAGVLGTESTYKGDVVSLPLLLLFHQEINGSYTWILENGMLSVPSDDPWLPKNVSASHFLAEALKETGCASAKNEAQEDPSVLKKSAQPMTSIEVLRRIEESRFGKTWCIFVKKEKEKEKEQQSLVTTNLSSSTIGECASYSTRQTSQTSNSNEKRTAAVHTTQKAKGKSVPSTPPCKPTLEERVLQVLARYGSKLCRKELRQDAREQGQHQEQEPQPQEPCWTVHTQATTAAAEEDMKRSAPWNNTRSSQKRRAAAVAAAMASSNLLDQVEINSVNSGALLKCSKPRYLDARLLLEDYGELVADLRENWGPRSSPSEEDMQAALQVCMSIPAPRKPVGAWVVANVLAYVVGMESGSPWMHVVWNDDTRRRKLKVMVRESQRTPGLVTAAVFKSGKPYDIVSDVTLAAPGVRHKYGPSAWWDTQELASAFFLVCSKESMPTNIRDLVFSRLCMEDRSLHRGPPSQRAHVKTGPAVATKRPIRVSNHPDVVYLYPKPSINDVHIPYKWRGRKVDVSLDYCAGMLVLANAFLDSGDCDGASVWTQDLEEALEWFMHRHGRYPVPAYDKSRLFACIMEMHGQFVTEESQPERCVEAMRAGLVERVWVQEHSGRAVVLVLLAEDGPWMAVDEEGNVWSLDMGSACALVGGKNTTHVVNDYGMFYILSKFLRQSLSGAQQEQKDRKPNAAPVKYVRRGHLVRMVYEDMKTMVRVSKSAVERAKLIENASKLAGGQEDPTATYSMALVMTLLYDAMRRLNINPRLLASKDVLTDVNSIVDHAATPADSSSSSYSVSQPHSASNHEEFFRACASIGMSITRHAPQGKSIDTSKPCITLIRGPDTRKLQDIKSLPIVLCIPRMEEDTPRLQKVKV